MRTLPTQLNPQQRTLYLQSRLYLRFGQSLLPALRRTAQHLPDQWLLRHLSQRTDLQSEPEHLRVSLGVSLSRGRVRAELRERPVARHPWPVLLLPQQHGGIGRTVRVREGVRGEWLRVRVAVQQQPVCLHGRLCAVSPQQGLHALPAGLRLPQRLLPQRPLQHMRALPSHHLLLGRPVLRCSFCQMRDLPTQLPQLLGQRLPALRPRLHHHLQRQLPASVRRRVHPRRINM